jgi:signal transduction histidine kinase
METKLTKRTSIYSFQTDGAKRMKQIILDLLDYSRASKSLEGKEDVDLNEILSEFKQLRKNNFRKNQLQLILISCQYCIHLQSGYADPSLFIRQCTKVYRSRYTPKIEINAVENEKSGSFLLKTME